MFFGLRKGERENDGNEEGKVETFLKKKRRSLFF
jgi:hypothetical protein